MKSVSKILVTAFVLLLTGGMAVTALADAQGGVERVKEKKERQKGTQVRGVIQSINTEKKTITVKEMAGRKQKGDCQGEGKEYTFTVDDSTKITLDKKDVTLADLKEKDVVSVTYTSEKGEEQEVLKATMIAASRKGGDKKKPKEKD